MYTSKIGETHMSRDKLKKYNRCKMKRDVVQGTRSGCLHVILACYYKNNFARLLKHPPVNS